MNENQQWLPLDKGIAKKKGAQKVNEGSAREKTESRQEDRENKGPVISTVKPTNRGPRSSVLEETNSLTKLRKRGGTVTGGGTGSASSGGLKNAETNRRAVRGRRGRPTDESRRNDRDRLNATEDKEPAQDQDHLRSEDEAETEEEDCPAEGGEEDPENEESGEESDSKLKTRLRSARQDTEQEEKKEFKLNLNQDQEKQQDLEKKVYQPDSNVIAKTSLADVKPEEDESESRERDREPEPPPRIPDTLDPGGDDSKIENSNSNSGTNKTIEAVTSNKEEKETVDKFNSDIENSSSPSHKQASELVECTNKDGSVLERLSPLNAGPGRLTLLHDEQERSRHNESPVILAERINKPPVSSSGGLVHPHHNNNHNHLHQQQLHHHQEHQHLQQYQHLHPRYTASPVIHRLDSVSPHSHRSPYPNHHHLHHQQQLHHQHQGVLDIGDKSNHNLVQHHHQLSSTRHGDDAGSIMEMETGGNGAAVGGFPGVSGVASGVRGATTYGDSGSDSGISSLRSAGSGDERSGSRSSALSAEETTGTATTNIPTIIPVPATTSVTTTVPSPSGSGASTTPACIRHVYSVQHTSLMMAHTPQSSGSTIPVSAPPVGYQTPAAPASHHHHHPSAEMLWRPPRYPPLPHSLLAPGQPMPSEELVERERHDRIIR
ncbi:hypothetical protein KQX54_012710 [Cotesia glomerata]|uniref:Uncharacterized protein n=1 Tax=Cotesia glomerata TaxID=32391 RepID=A0AAV7ITG4_COTGL|nr:hypothetical protein KQX54_012710 [Cotesia glomerata]